MTIFEVYNGIKKELAEVTEDYVFEAKQLIKHITGYTNKEILMAYNEEVSEEDKKKIDIIIEKRKTHYPLQYILGSWEFYGIPFVVGEGVLIPRADTETLVEKALQKIENKRAAKVLDLCTGSGCIAITVAKKRTDVSVTALEKSDEALDYALLNMQQNEIKNMRLLKGDIFDLDAKDMKYDLIVSNPPYVTAEEMKHLQKEVTYEPASALYGGEDGLTYYRTIASGYKDALNEGGILGFEIGENQGEAVKKILDEAGYKNTEILCDIEDRQRVVFGTVDQI